jgi:hypothetical protein
MDRVTLILILLVVVLIGLSIVALWQGWLPFGH